MASLRLQLLRCIFCLLVLPSLGVFAEEMDAAIQLFDEDSYLVNLHMDVLRDTSNKLTLEQITTQEYQEKFKRNDQEILNLGITPYSYWLKFTLSYPAGNSNSESSKNWYLEVGRSLLDNAVLYTPDSNGGYTMMKSDLSVNFQDRYLRHVNSIFPVVMNLGEKKTYYLKVKNISTSIQFPLLLWKPSAFMEKSAIEEFVVGVFFGCMTILLLYNLFLYLSVRDVSYLNYVGYLGAVTVFQLLEIGHGAIHSGWFFEMLGKEWMAAVIWIASWYGVQFARDFMNIQKAHPRIDNFLVLLQRVIIVSTIISLFKNDYISIIWVSLFAVFFTGTLLFISLYIYLQGNENAKFFFLAWTCNILGFIIYALMANEILPATTITLLSAPLGILLEAALLSFALAERIKHESRKALKADMDAMENLSHYRSVFDNSIEGMYHMSVFGEIRNANLSMARMMGFSNVSLLLDKGRAVATALFESDKDNYNLLVKKGSIKNEVMIHREGGGVSWVIHSATLINEGQGKYHIEGTVVDVTDEKEKEVAVSEELKERMQKKMAAEETEQKSQFLSAMSHHIRTPLTAIIGYGETLQDDSFDADNKEFCINTVVDNSRLLLQLINNILDYSKIEAGKLSIESMPVHIKDMVDDIVQECSDAAHSKSLCFDVEYLYPIPNRVMGDPTRIDQVLRILCRNALSHTSCGGVTITVSYKEDLLLFSIEDTGVGIDNSTLEGLFNEQALLDSSGLGLAISKKLAVLMGGDITGSSEKGVGSVFNFSVKGKLVSGTSWMSDENGGVGEILASKRAKEAEKGVERGASKGAVIPNLKGTVLLAEDNIVNQKLVKKVLEKTGVSVVIACNGEEACDYCEKSPPDFVLMDINMPVRNGVEATQYIRSKQHVMPIYALTAETDKEQIDNAIRAGCNGYLSKPIDRSYLYDVLKEALQH